MLQQMWISNDKLGLVRPALISYVSLFTNVCLMKCLNENVVHHVNRCRQISNYFYHLYRLRAIPFSSTITADSFSLMEGLA